MNDLKIALGQCFWIGINGTTLDDPYSKEIFKTFQPGGICLFQRNVESIEQVTKLNSSLQKASSIPMFLAVDQEGGTVERLHKLIGSIPPAMALAAARAPRGAKKIHTAHARILNALGFNVNFTPVLDLAVQNADNGLGTRCFSNHPPVVARFAREVIDAHGRAGVLPCGKHFPGLGDTDRDSHQALPTVPRSWKQIEREDLYPYKKLLSKLPFIMINHALYPEKNSRLPASLAKEIVTDFLLRKWNYEGFSISDDLIMGAVSNLYNLTESCEKALAAGNHLFLICRPEEVVVVFKKLLRRVQRSEKLQQTVYRNCSKILSYKFEFFKQPKRVISIPQEIRRIRKYSESLSEAAITPMRFAPIQKSIQSCTLFYPRTKWLSEGPGNLLQFLERKGIETRAESFALQISDDEGARLAAKSNTEWNVVVVTNPGFHQGQMKLIQDLVRKKKKVAVICGAFPFAEFPEEIKQVIAAYWTWPDALKAAIRGLIGERKMKGHLPFR
jgi:beta-N-acetylhexosaminidase